MTEALSIEKILEDIGASVQATQELATHVSYFGSETEYIISSMRQLVIGLKGGLVGYTSGLTT